MKKKQMKRTAPASAAVKEKKVAPAAVEAKKADCGCGNKDCKCGPDCKCGCGCAVSETGRFVILGVILAAIVAVLVVVGISCATGSHRPAKTAHQPQMAKNINDRAIREFIQKNPDFIIETLDKYVREQQAKQVPPPPQEADAAMLKELLADKSNIVLGNPKGSFVIVEFFDYQCGYCKMMNKKLPDAIKKSDNIRWVLMPLPIFGEKSETIARYAIASAKQGKFEKFHRALEDQKDMSEDALIELAKSLKLDTEKLKADAKTDEVKNKLAKIRDYANKLHTNGVPMFIINGKIQPGAFPDEVLEQHVKTANEMKKKK